MHSRLIVLLLLSTSAATHAADPKFQLTGKSELERGTEPPIIDVDYTGANPTAGTPYLDPGSWKIFWTAKGQTQIHRADVISIAVDTAVQKLQLTLTGDTPKEISAWSVLLNPTGPPSVMPQMIAGTAPKEAPSASGQPAPNAKPVAKKSCDNAADSPKFCPPSGSTPADFTLTASFLAAGGTKPIYSLSLKGKYLFQDTVIGFHPGVSTDFEINQNTKPPVAITTFSPNSITAGLAFNRVLHFNPSAPGKDATLYGAILNFNLPSEEMSVSSPSNNIIFNPSISLILNSWQPRSHPSVYGTLYPFFAFEGGENLIKPTTIDKIAVNWSNYGAIVRGVSGADAALVKVSSDKKGNSFSLTGTYRVRLPAFDEPEVRTLHEITTVRLDSKARHWVEADINAAPWSFKYLTITGKYQYGELPPLFQLVDHSFTIGFTLQAVQANKDK